jgi:hypothetical protein
MSYYGENMARECLSAGCRGEYFGLRRRPMKFMGRMHTDELRGLVSSPNIVCMITCGRK